MYNRTSIFVNDSHLNYRLIFMFPTPALTALCACIYGLCSWLSWRQLRSEPGAGKSGVIVRSCAIIAVAIHGYLLYGAIFVAGAFSISLGLSVSTAGWISVLIYLCASHKPAYVNLGVILLPIAMVTVIIGVFVPEAGGARGRALVAGTGWHIALAIPTYGVLCVAFAQACLLIAQDRHLHKISPGRLMTALPAIQTMERNLKWLILLGFGLMSLNLVSGIGANILYQGQLFEFNHHIVLSIIAWGCFACLLGGQIFAGWRGRTAAKWTIFAFCMLVLAYFGARFVNDVILDV